MINYLTLKNFRRHREAHFDFGPGLNVICGPNWAGKTTLLSAITYALFGTKAVQGSAADLVTDGESDMLVQVGFSFNERDYFITRGPKKADLREGSSQGKPIATGQTPVTEEIESLIGSSTKDFLDFNVTRQEDSASLLALGSAKLGEYVARVTGIDTIDDVLKKLKVEVAVADSLKNTWTDKAEEIDALRSDIDDKTGATNRAKASLGLMEVGLEFRKRESSELAEQAEAMRQQLEACQEAKRKLAVQKGILANAQGALKEATEACPKKPESDLEALTVAHREAAAACEYGLWHDQVCDDLSKAIENAKANLILYGDEPVTADVTAAFQKVIDIDKQVSEAKTRYEHAHAASENSVCPYCMRAFEDVDQEKLAEDRDKAAKDLEELTAKEEKLTQAHKEAEKTKHEADEWWHGRDQWQNYLEASQTQLKEHTLIKFARVTIDAVERHSRKLTEATHEWGIYKDSAATIDRRKNDVNDAKAALKSASADKGVKGPTQGEVEAAARKAKEVTDEAHASMLEISKLTNTINLNTLSLAQMKTEVENLIENAGKRQKADQRFKETKELQTYLRKNRERFTESFWIQLLEHASEFARNATSGAVSALKIGNGFTYVEDGRERSVSGNASGMQKAIFSTAIKLSLAAALGSRFDVLFFDEVTAAAGDDTSLLFTSLLAKSSQQAFLVTHRQADASAADQVIEVAYR